MRKAVGVKSGGLFFIINYFLEMPSELFTFNGKDITMNICFYVLEVTREIVLWAESVEYIADRFDSCRWGTSPDA